MRKLIVYLKTLVDILEDCEANNLPGLHESGKSISSLAKTEEYDDLLYKFLCIVDVDDLHFENVFGKDLKDEIKNDSNIYSTSIYKNLYSVFDEIDSYCKVRAGININ